MEIQTYEVAGIGKVLEPARESGGLIGGKNDKFLQLVFLFFTSLFDQVVKIHVHPMCCRRYQAAFPHPLHYFLPPIGPKVSGMLLR